MFGWKGVDGGISGFDACVCVCVCECAPSRPLSVRGYGSHLRHCVEGVTVFVCFSPLSSFSFARTMFTHPSVCLSLCVHLSPSLTQFVCCKRLLYLSSCIFLYYYYSPHLVIPGY